PINVPKNKYNNVSELLMRINYTLISGNFELDYNNGEIRYRIGHHYKNIIFNKQSIQDIFSTAVTMLHEHFPYIAKVIYSDETVDSIFSDI
ncbi:MAG: hypothetical protein AB8G11_04570, partial [Saprospiraceae bacterium]